MAASCSAVSARYHGYLVSGISLREYYLGILISHNEKMHCEGVVLNASLICCTLATILQDRAHFDFVSSVACPHVERTEPKLRTTIVL